MLIIYTINEIFTSDFSDSIGEKLWDRETTCYVCQVSLGLAISLDFTFRSFFLSSYFSLLRLSKSPTVFHSGRQIEGFSKAGAGVEGIICMCVCYLRLGVRKNSPGISLLSFCLGSSNFMDLYCHPTLWPSVCHCHLSPHLCLSPPSLREGALHLKWYSNRFLNGELSLQTLPPWVCGQSLLFWFSGDSHL